MDTYANTARDISKTLKDVSKYVNKGYDILSLLKDYHLIGTDSTAEELRKLFSNVKENPKYLESLKKIVEPTSKLLTTI